MNTSKRDKFVKEGGDPSHFSVPREQLEGEDEGYMG